jgi:hypothetical protein
MEMIHSKKQKKKKQDKESLRVEDSYTSNRSLAFFNAGFLFFVITTSGCYRSSVVFLLVVSSGGISLFRGLDNNNNSGVNGQVSPSPEITHFCDGFLLTTDESNQGTNHTN